jgi:hypothetical protein
MGDGVEVDVVGAVDESDPPLWRIKSANGVRGFGFISTSSIPPPLTVPSSSMLNSRWLFTVPLRFVF